MRIIMCGAHSTGKTTVAEILANDLKLPRRESVSRKSPYEPGTVENQQFIMRKVYQENVSNLYDGHILERSVFDVNSYTRYFGLKPLYNFDNMKMDTAARIFKSNQSYILFYFPITFGLVGDGVRPEGVEAQKSVDARIKNNLDMRDISYYTMPNSTPAKRAEYIKEKVGHYATV